MISIDTVDTIIKMLALFISYCIAVTFANIFHAWVAKQMGDDTGEEDGFITLDPLVHIDPIGLLLLVTVGFGWGRSVLVNPFNIVGKWHRLRIFIASCADVIAYIGIAVIALVLTLVVDKNTRTLYSLMYFHADEETLSTAAKAMALQMEAPATHSFMTSLFMTLTLILSQIVSLCVFLGTLFFFINTIDTVLLLIAEETQSSVLLRYCHSRYRLLILNFLLLTLFFFVVEDAYEVLFSFVKFSAVSIVRSIGLL